MIFDPFHTRIFKAELLMCMMEQEYFNTAVFYSVWFSIEEILFIKEMLAQ